MSSGGYSRYCSLGRGIAQPSAVVILAGMDEQVLADDGRRLWAAWGGRGDPLVFCHGGPGLWDTFDDLAAMFAGVARTIRWDQRGCGRSEGGGPYSVARSIRDLDAVRHRLAGAQTALLGHSWGAYLALRYALEHPGRVTSLIYVSGTGIDADRRWHPAYEQNLRRRIGEHLPRWEKLKACARNGEEERELAILQWSADFADADDALLHAERMATPWFGINYDCNAAIGADAKHELATADLATRCEALDIPVLIIDGTEDIRPRWGVDSLYQALPNARRVSLPGAGHLPWIEMPQQFRHAVASFLS